MLRNQVHSCMKYFSDKSSLDIRAQLYPGLAMTYLPFLTSLRQSQQPQCKELSMMEPDSSATRLEMASLRDERRSREVGRSCQPSLLYLAGCLLVVGLLLVLSLVLLPLLIFSPPEASQDSDLFNVLLVGGRGEDNSSLVTVELLNIGRCPAESSTDLLLPSLPLPLSPLTVSHLSATNSIAVCGEDSQEDWRCFTLRTSSTTWESSPVTEGGEEHSVSYSEEGDDGEALQLSHRHGASLLTLTDRLLLLGGRR